MNVLLAYVSYPATTAAYLERALRNIAQVKTIGPKLPSRLLTQWKLENLKEPITSHDFEVEMDVDMASVSIQNYEPDLYFWVESVPGYFPKNLNALKCPKACYLIDTYSNHPWYIEWAKQFDYVFLADLSYVEKFRTVGVNAYWLPLGCDPDIHSANSLEKKYDIGFVGTVTAGTERFAYLNALDTKFPLHYERSFLKEMANTFGQSKIVFNNAVGKTDLNMRFFEAMACGTLLLSDMAQRSGQDILFVPQKDYALYDQNNILEVTEFYLKDDIAREAVSKSGQNLVLAAHTYQHRMENMLEVVLGKVNNTLNPWELRDFALSKIQFQKDIATQNPFSHLINADSVQRSFIIPVLDYSPASSFNIKTLLEDLTNIGGEVIVIFNNEQVADEMKDHPRINHYAVMKENIGVARAWNLGIDICRTDYAFILNADLKVGKKTIETLHDGLKNLPDVAMVGPQGSYFNFEKLKDYFYLDKGKFSNIMEVDAVSGFLFGLKTCYFKNKDLRFEDGFTPCYYEEWDIGLQIKAASLKSYIIPCDDYEHQWSGSIRSYRQIRYYDQAETAKQIHLRNSYLFQKKWRDLEQKINIDYFLDSAWLKILLVQFEIAVSKKLSDVAKKFIDQLAHYFPEREEVANCKKVFSEHFPNEKI
jgi:GT2 family glycosyltransferase